MTPHHVTYCLKLIPKYKLSIYRTLAVVFVKMNNSTRGKDLVSCLGSFHKEFTRVYLWALTLSAGMSSHRSLLSSQRYHEDVLSVCVYVPLPCVTASETCPCYQATAKHLHPSASTFPQWEPRDKWLQHWCKLLLFFSGCAVGGAEAT